MHETAVVAGLMRILTERAAAAEIERIVSVRLKIGRLRGLDSRQIRGAFELFAEGTPAEGARLDIDEVAIEAVCLTCGTVYTVPGWRFECPSCGGNDADTRTGRELHVESFEGTRRAAAVDESPEG
ncbi:hydrogenase maturation nickel metallochaperone HypA [Siculibacillus lacustris]|uniref:Hydrogenase maturation factor HypA n=1 Tax=Siculibacillus lacustris TaxID=1549641 RepID=A0A4Q9VPA2_9HYPH|nr:hydrogenase maturation nickel metallochaperone HypA [Siculibacillus lacustris]TBW36632.1 hydrogenase maturation nickel metallochaperone HypA [Siculibacillus lacustris]